MPESRTGTAAEEPGPDAIVEANEAAAEFFSSCLPGSWAEAYLRQDRGLDAAAQDRWGLGCAPGGPRQWTALLGHLRDVGISGQVAVAAGLARESSRGTLIDAFRDRAMFPIRDAAGRAVAFAGRARPDAPDGTDKYVNTRTTAVWSKHRVLYGLWEARPALAAGARPALVEGYLDVIAVTESCGTALAGVASCGTGLSPEQVQALAGACDLARSPLLDVRDPDKAGRKAAARDYGVVLPWCPAPGAVSLPDDPARVFETRGPAALAAALAAGEHPLADIAVDAVLDRWDRRVSWPDPDTAHLVDPWPLEYAMGAAREAAELIAPAWPHEPTSRQAARIALRTGLPWSWVHHQAHMSTLPPGSPSRRDWSPPVQPGWEPPPGLVRAMAAGTAPAQDGPPATRPPPGKAAALPPPPPPRPAPPGPAGLTRRRSASPLPGFHMETRSLCPPASPRWPAQRPA